MFARWLYDFFRLPCIFFNSIQMALLHTEEPDCGFFPRQKIMQLELQF